MMAHSKMIHVITNFTLCAEENCFNRSFSLKKALNHAINSRHAVRTQCYCGEKLDGLYSAEIHLESCKFLGTFGCSECNAKFRDLVSANNHGWSTHGHNGVKGRHTFELVATVTFDRSDEFEAQVRKKTKWDHMQWNQIEERARNNSLKRTMIRDLLMESDFTAANSKIYRLAQLSRGKLPAFKKTLGNKNYFRVKITCEDGTIEVLLNPADREFAALYNSLRDFQVFDAQAWFVPDEITHKVDFGDHMNDIVRSVSSCLDKVGASVTLTRQVISFLCKLTVTVRSGFDPITIGAMLLDTLVGSGISHSMALEVIGKIKDRLRSAFTLLSDHFQAQVADFDPLSSLATIFGMIGGTILMQKIPSDGQISALVKGVCQLGNLARGATFAWSALERVIKFACEKIFEWQTGFPAAISEVEGLVAGCQQWYSEVQKLISQHTSEEIARHPGKVLEVQSLVRQGLQMKAQLQEYRIDPKLMTAFDVHFRVLQLFFFQAQSSGAFRGGPRVEPINIYIHGKSGVGKTGLISFLAIDLLKIDGMPKKQGRADYTEELYYRAIEQEFWDGYCGQRIVVYDDFGQLIDSQQKPNLEYMEWIRTGNMAPMPLHMAHLQDKAKSFFTSRVVIATSNNSLSDLKIPSLSAPEAFKRRIDICVEVTNAPEFTKLVEEKYGERVERLDQRKVESLTGKPFSTKSYRFKMRHVQTGEQIGKIMDYDQFRNKCVKLYEERARNSKNLTQVLEEHAQESFTCQISDELYGYLSNEKAQISLNPNAKEVFEEFTVPKVGSFLRRGHDEMRDLFAQNVNEMFDELKKDDRYFRLDKMDPVDMDDLEVQWLEALDKVNLDTWWTLEAEKILLGKFQSKTFAGIGALLRCLPMKDQYNHIQPFIDHIFVPRTENVEVAEALQRVEEESRPLWREWLDCAKDMVKKHPWLTAITAVVALLGVKYWFDTREDRRQTSKPPLDHHHAGLKFGERIEHGHNCEVCGCYFRHTHTIKTFQESIKYDQMCEKCTQWVAVEVYDRADEMVKNDAKEQCRLALGWVKTEVPVNEQVGSSGDAKTAKKSQTRTQGPNSGDDKTAKKSQTRTQGISGDAKTNKKAQDRTQMDELEAQLQHFDMKDMNAHLQSDPNSLQLSKKVLNNMYNLDLKIDGEWKRMLKLMMIRGRVGLTAGHLERYLKQATDIRIWNATKKDGHIFSTGKLNTVHVVDASGERKDQMLIEFPPSLHDHFDLVRNMATTVELSAFVRARACIVVPFEQGAILRTGPVEKKMERPRKYTDAEGSYKICDRFEYAGMETAAGDCGSPLVAIGTSLARKLIGIHVCGKHNIGVASPLNEQDILRALEELPMESQICMQGESILAEFKAPWELELPDGNYTAAGESLYRIPLPNKTALRPSLISGKLQEPTTAPSVLSREAMEKGLKKAGNIPPELDEELLDVAINDVKTIVNSGVRRVTRVLTEEEAIQGIEGDEFIQPIKRQTSPGYPYTGSKPPRKGAGKEPWLGQGEDYRLDNDLREKMRERVAMAKRGERMPAPFIDTLKDERRPHEKIEAKKTRVFAAGAMDYTLVFRMYFLAFAAHVMHNRIDNEISVGTNVYSFDWTKTASRVTSKGQKVIAGDFSNFDGTLLLPVLYKILDIINDFYNDGNDLIRHVLWKEIVNSIHVKGNSVYLWTHSQPSGCPITAILNSLYNSVSMRYVWLLKVPREFRTMRHFNEHVAMVSYGDDNLVNISDEVIEYFNQLTIADGYEQIGMKYTDESKSGNMVAYRTLTECSYLKRGFLWDEEELQWHAPLDFGTILEMTNWIRQDLDPEAATISNLETSYFELHLHGRKKFEEWRPRYWEVCRHLEQKPRLPLYIELRYDEERKQGRLF
nr:hypothetical protein 1 [Beihai picorna-like virus 72]